MIGESTGFSNIEKKLRSITGLEGCFSLWKDFDRTDFRILKEQLSKGLY
jgi:hypothetical protein